MSSSSLWTRLPFQTRGVDPTIQGFLQDKVGQSHKVLDMWMLTDVLITYMPVEMCFMTWNKVQNTNTHFQGIIDSNYDFKTFFAPSFFTHPVIFLPVRNGFYPSK